MTDSDLTGSATSTSDGSDPLGWPDLPAPVQAAVAPVRAMLPDVPPDLLVRGLMAMTYLFGAVSFELFGHRYGVVADHDAFFAHEIHYLADALGLR